MPHNRATAIEPQPTIFTGWTAPVIRKAEDGARAGAAGLRSYRMAAPRSVTNVRDDRILTSRFWKPSFEQRRCLVPASSYCEPDSGKPVKWHWFAVNGERRLPHIRFSRNSCAERSHLNQSRTNAGAAVRGADFETWLTERQQNPRAFRKPRAKMPPFGTEGELSEAAARPAS